MPIKIVWFSNVDLTETKQNKSGTWIHSMYHKIKQFDEVTILANFSFSNVKRITLSNSSNNFKQYYVPIKSFENATSHDGIYIQIANMLSDLKPDIIHIWGTESSWCKLSKSNLFKSYPILIEIQGLKFICGDKRNFYAGLSESQIMRMNGLLEILHPHMKIENVRKSFENWGIIEKEILSSAHNINTQSQWVRDVLSVVAPNANIYNTDIILRDSFLISKPWYIAHHFCDDPILFTTTSIQPYKGFHVTLKAFSHVLKKYPKAQLRVAGINIKQPYYRNVGYVRFLLKLIRIYGLQNNVYFLGNIDASELVEEMTRSDIFINSSYIESYCLALAEALSFGIPCVSSYTSALTELITDNITGLFYPLGDDYICATRIIDLLGNENLRKQLSYNSSSYFRSRIDSYRIVNQQIETYKSILSKFNKLV